MTQILCKLKPKFCLKFGQKGYLKYYFKFDLDCDLKHELECILKFDLDLIEIIIKNGIYHPAPPLQSCQLTPSKLDTCTFVTVLKSEHLKPIKKFL